MMNRQTVDANFLNPSRRNRTMTAIEATLGFARHRQLAATLLIVLWIALWGGVTLAGPVEVSPAERSAALLRVLENRAMETDTQSAAIASMHRSLEKSQELARAALARNQEGRGHTDSESLQQLLLEGQNLRYAYEALRTTEESPVRLASPGGRLAGRENRIRKYGSASSRDQRSQALRAAKRILDLHEVLEQSLGMANRGRTNGLLRRFVNESVSALNLIQRQSRVSRLIQHEAPEIRKAPVALESQPAKEIRPLATQQVQNRAGTVVTPEITALRCRTEQRRA